jgi:hypothetical protein
MASAVATGNDAAQVGEFCAEDFCGEQARALVLNPVSDVPLSAVAALLCEPGAKVEPPRFVCDPEVHRFMTLDPAGENPVYRLHSYTQPKHFGSDNHFKVPHFYVAPQAVSEERMLVVRIGIVVRAKSQNKGQFATLPRMGVVRLQRMSPSTPYWGPPPDKESISQRWLTDKQELTAVWPPQQPGTYFVQLLNTKRLDKIPVEKRAEEIQRLTSEFEHRDAVFLASFTHSRSRVASSSSSDQQQEKQPLTKQEEERLALRREKDRERRKKKRAAEQAEKQKDLLLAAALMIDEAENNATSSKKVKKEEESVASSDSPQPLAISADDKAVYDALVSLVGEKK